MRIFYVGQLWPGSTSGERMKTLEMLGHEIVPFDTTAWVSQGSRIMLSMGHRWNVGANVKSLNRTLKASAARVGYADVVWIDRGPWIEIETLRELRTHTHGILLHFTLDPHFFSNHSHHFIKALYEYDIVVTTKRYELEFYEQYGAKRIILVLQGYDPRFEVYERSVDKRQNWSSEVVFIGHCEPHYARTLKVIKSECNDLRIWGPRWRRYAYLHRWARAYVKSDGVWGDDYLHALAYTKIALGLLGKTIPETTTTRTFEIPAVGAFLLAERNDDHLSLFQEGAEAEFFDSDEELRDKVHYYLRNETAREKIAAAGRRRALQSGYSSYYQLRKVLGEIELLNK